VRKNNIKNCALMSGVADLPGDSPAFLRHSDEDTPIPTWKQVTRSTKSADPEFLAHVSRIISGTDDEQVAQATWNTWPGNCQRSIALLVDKIYYEGWLDSVGPIKGWPWDGGFFFWPRFGEEALAGVLNSKSGSSGAYTECKYQNGLSACLARWTHRAWKWSWMENDSPFAALHIGVFKDGSAEVHLDAFNPLYVNGTPRSHIIKLPMIGSYNRKLFRLHRRWEQSRRYAPIVRTSANFYHLMLGRVPLCF
jgi:hypothetical protein